jgi:DNA topoisomerase-1
MPKLLIVESPGKLKTLRQILGRDWILEASVGHTTELASDGHHNWGFDLLPDRVQTRYVPRGDRGAKVLAQLKRAVKAAEAVYLATDPDREGEAIAWHLVDQLRLRNFHRVSYTQITEAAVKRAIANPGKIDLALVDAQRARQCLDKLVGFEVSPLLWNSTGGKSAGRVQTATLHLVCERERERLAFKPEEYWVLRSVYGEGFEALFEKAPPAGALPGGESEKVRTEAEARAIETTARTSPHRVGAVEKKDETRSPPPPFITSSLQQAAGSRFRFSPKKTMQIAQELYEGVNGKGLITYMRTDSTSLSPEFTAEAADWLRANSPRSLPERPPTYRAKSDAQDAHEAIRPTSVAFTPKDAGAKLSPEQAKIYSLIWERAIASQCKPAILSRTKVVVECAETRWVARGMTVVDPGYLEFWKNTDDEKTLPALAPGRTLAFRDVKTDRRKTEPPPRYTEPKLVQLMEKKGIGRPSTYASTIATLKDREYVRLEKDFVVPTGLGMATDETLGKALPDLVNADFTAKMEADLDAIAEKKLSWERFLIDWNRSYFEPALAKARQAIGALPFTPRPRVPSASASSARSQKSRSTPIRGAPGGAASAKTRKPWQTGIASPLGLNPPAGPPTPTPPPRPTTAADTKLGKAEAKARKAGLVPICPRGQGELALRHSSKGTFYWKCAEPACDSMAWYADLSSEKGPECGLPMEKIKSSKVTGGTFLKCRRPDRHAEDVVLVRNRVTKAWERPRSR